MRRWSGVRLVVSTLGVVTAGCGLIAGSGNFSTQCPAGSKRTADGHCVQSACGTGQLLLPNGSCAVSQCGDGMIDTTLGEECEPPSTATCDASCHSIKQVCGDGKITAPEQCEPPNTPLCDGDCHLIVPSSCGDGKVTAGEQCEPPNTATCDSQCQSITCGDGKITAPEQCDDGGTDNLDGCDATCRVEPVYRMDTLDIEPGAPPAWCAVTANAIGSISQSLPWNLAGQDNMGFWNGAINQLFLFDGMDDPGGAVSTLGIGSVSGFPDPAKGEWPVKLPSAGTKFDPTDWWFLVDSDTVNATGVPLAHLAATVKNRVFETGAGDYSLRFGDFAVPSTLDLVSAKLRGRLGGATTPDAKIDLAPGLTVVESLDGSAPDYGMCGGVTVDSLARIRLPQFIGPSVHCNSGLTFKTCKGRLDSSCNSLLDVIVGGCASSNVNIQKQPDLPGSGPSTLVPDPTTRKIPRSQTAGNTNAYSFWFSFKAVRENVTGIHQVPPPSCDSTATPAEDPCVIDDKFGVFVDPTNGDDMNGDGSQKFPFKSVEFAVPAAVSSGKRVYICQGTENTPGVLLRANESGLQIYGGLSCKDWSYVGTGTVLKGDVESGGEALQLDHTSDIHIEDVELQSATTGAYYMSDAFNRIGAIVEDSSNIVFRHVRFTGTDATSGQDGMTKPAGQASAAGFSGAAACTTGSGANGGSGSCPFPSTGPQSPGGKGGDAGSSTVNPTDGAPGSPSSSTTGLGGLADDGSSTWSCAVGTGGDGAPGADGTPGAGGSGKVTLSPNLNEPERVLVLSAATSGTAGKPGQGGGGGGGARAASTAGVCSGGNIGASGGGGGAGGCPGAGGPGGGAGGSSIGLVSINSSVQLFACEVHAGTGGNGGNGAPGTAGAAGGAGGPGGSGAGTSTDACPGGHGGKGGHGGPGGGGSGGYSLGIAYSGTAPVYDPATTFSVASVVPSGGLDGDGSSVHGGSKGQVAKVMGF